MSPTVTTACILLTLISYQYSCADLHKPLNKGEIKTHIDLQSLIPSPFHHQPAHLGPSLSLMKSEKLQEEDPFMMNDEDRWELILSKTHPYKAKFQHDRDKYKQKSRLIK